jgi:chaperonin GroES
MPRAASKEPSDKQATPARRSRKSATKHSAKRSEDQEVRLTGDRLIVRVQGNGERKSAGGLLIPATAMPAPRKLQWADVALIGPDVRVAQQGDRVLFLPSSGLEVELDGEELVLLRERDIQAVSPTPTSKEDRTPGQYL